MNPKLAKQAAVVLGWPTRETEHTTKMAGDLNILLPEVARWCGEKGCLLELAYGGVDDHGSFDSSWDCAISNGRHSVYVESDDPATAICLALLLLIRNWKEKSK